MVSLIQTHIRYFFSRILLACISIISSTAIFSQDIAFEYFGISDGLSHNSVQCMLQDQQGFIWFGTEDGLNRFDGYEFKIFRPSDTENSISGLFIWDIDQDKDGNLWIGTNNGGLSKYDPIFEKFTHFKNTIEDPTSLGSNYVRSVLVDNANNVWVGTYGGGLNLLQEDKEEFIVFKKDENDTKSIASNVVASIYQDSRDRLWVGTEGGLNLYNPLDSSFVLYAHDLNDPNSITHNQIDAVIEDTTGTIWVGTKHGLNQFDESKNHFIRYYADETKENSLSDNLITSLFIDKDGLIWIGTDGGGITIFNPYEKRFKKVMHEPSDPESLSINLVRRVFQDNIGIFWVATNGGGICKYVPVSKKFHHDKYESHDPSGLSHNVVRAFCKDDQQRLWIGTVGGGINIFDPIDKEYKKIIHEADNPITISSNVVISLLQHNKNTYWAGTWEAGVNKITFKPGFRAGKDPNKYISDIKQIWHDPEDPNTISSDIVQAIFRDNHNFVWFGTGSGIDIYDELNDRFINLGNRKDDSTSLSDNRVQSGVLQDRHGNIWIGTWDGLNRMNYPQYLKLNKTLEGFEPAAVSFKRFYHDTAKNSISDNRVISLWEDKISEKLTIWAGTYGGGLNKIVFDSDGSENYSVFHYTTQNGLPSNVIYGIQGDEHGNLWMSTNNGISMMNIETGTFRNYNESEGVQSRQFYWGSGLKDDTGAIYFGGVNGYNYFHSDSIYNQSVAPKVLITDVKIYNESIPIGTMPDGRAILDKSLSLANELTLTYVDKVVSFEFASLHFVAPKLNQHAYMLEGIDKDWHYINDRRFVTYTNLPHGEYTFKVKGSNNEGVWGNQPATLKVTVKPPFWKTIGFRVLLIVFLILMFVLLYRYRLQSIEERNRQLEIVVKRKTSDLQHEIEERKKIEINLRESENKLKELNANKDKFFKIIAHDLRNPINVALGFSELLSRNFTAYEEDKKEKFIHSIFQATSNVNNLLENLLQWSLAQSGKISVNMVPVNLSDMLKSVITVLEENLESKEISVEISIDTNLVVFTDKDMIKTVVRNVLTNAIKFTPRTGTISISYSCSKNGFVELCITDSGVGMSDEQVANLFKIEMASTTRGTDGEKGTGLGLLLCKEFVELSKGDIWAESTKGKGSRFFISLPVAN